MGIVITIMSGYEDGRKFEFDKDSVVIGRHPQDDVSLPYEGRLSRHHARISFRQMTGSGCYGIEDVGPEGKGSTNGTYINNQRISGVVYLKPGELASLGGVWIKFEAK